MKILVVVPVLNEENYIVQCLSSLLEQDYPNEKYSIVVVDNGSTDRTREYVAKYKNRIAMIEKLDGTIGAVRNYGAKYCDSDLIAFLDGDSVAPSSWLSLGANMLLSEHDVSCVGFSVCQPSINSSWVAKVWHEMNSGSKYSGTLYVNWLSSFNLMIKRGDFNSINGFDENLATCEDYDFGIRLSNISKLVYSDKICISHLGVVGGMCNFVKKEFWRGQNNLESFIKEKKTIISCASIALPFSQVFITFIGLFSFLFQSIPVPVSLGISFFFPILLSLRKIQVSTLKIYPQIIFLYFLYLNARGWAVIGSLWRR